MSLYGLKICLQTQSFLINLKQIPDNICALVMSRWLNGFPIPRMLEKY